MSFSDFLSKSYFGNTIEHYLIFFAMLAIGIIAGKLIYWVSKNIIRKFAARTKTKFDDIIIDVMEKPLIFLVFILAFHIGGKYLEMSDSFKTFYSGFTEFMIVVAVTWFIIKFLDALILNYITPMTSKTETDLDDHLVPILRKLIKIILVVIVAIMLISNLGYNVTSILTGLGLGGLAFALAAQDMLSNMFGGISILADKQFKMGDRVKVGNDVDGFVREIGLRTTKIETLQGTQLIVPNSLIAKSAVENIQREPARRVLTKIGVDYATSNSKMELAVNIIRDAIEKNNPNKKQPPKVFFTNFGESALEITIIYWVKDIQNLLQVQHSVNMQIKKEFEKSKISIAYPTRTINVKNVK